MTLETLIDQTVNLLKGLIEIPSFSKDEQNSSNHINRFFIQRNIQVQRISKNIIVRNKHFSEHKPTILLNSHHDTVKPSKSWKRDPFNPEVKSGKLYGLGSNDAGGALVCLIAAFLHFYEMEDLKYNLVLAATTEEEISGQNGVELVIPELPKIDFALVGEPTGMKMAIAEKGLMVLDCIAHGKPGHAARKEGVNAIYEAMQDIEWFREFKFPKESKLLGPVKMTVTVINGGTKHNVIPDECRFIVDVRTTDAYSNEDTLAMIKKHVKSETYARSTRLQPSRIPEDHKLMEVAKKLGIETFGSPTLSDQALIPFHSVKMGPGESARSHTADEFIKLEEIELGVERYIALLSEFV